MDGGQARDTFSFGGLGRGKKKKPQKTQGARGRLAPEVGSIKRDTCSRGCE